MCLGWQHFKTGVEKSFMENFQPAYCSRWEKPGGKPHACSSLDMFDFFLELKNRSPIIPSLFFSIHTSSQHKQFSHCPEIWSCSQDEAVTYWTSGKSNISHCLVCCCLGLVHSPTARAQHRRAGAMCLQPAPIQAAAPSKERRCTMRTLNSRTPQYLGT